MQRYIGEISLRAVTWRDCRTDELICQVGVGGWTIAVAESGGGLDAAREAKGSKAGARASEAETLRLERAERRRLRRSEP